MFYQRITAFMLAAAVGSVAIQKTILTAAESKNPFAQWESLQSKTEPSKTQKRSSMQYFNAKSGAEKEQPEASLQTAVKKERLTVGAPSAESKTESAASPKSSLGVGVTTAEFMRSESGSGVKQTAGEFGSDGNPFAEFLGTDEPSESPSEPDAVAPDFQLPPPPAPQLPAFAETVVPRAKSGPLNSNVRLEWQHGGEFNIGEETSCTLVVENAGRSTVRNVVVEAALPQGLQVVSSQPLPESTGETATWSFSELGPKSRQEIKLIVLPGLEGDHQLNAVVRVTGSSSSTFSVRQPKVDVEIQGPGSVEIGQVAHYTVTVSNPGSGPAQNVVIQAVVPDGLENRHGRRLSIDIGTLNAGEVRQARLTITGVAGGDHNLAVRVLGDGNLSAESSSIVAVAEPQLNIGLRGPSTTTLGKPAEYEIVVINEGKLESNNVRAKFRLPEGYTFLSAAAGGKESQEEGTVDWFVGTLKPGDLKHFTVTLMPQATGVETLKAGVISEHGAAKVTEHSTTVSGSAELKLEVVSSAPSVNVGGEAIFEIQISNSGSIAAENVGLSCELPTGLKLVDISGPSKYVEDSGAVVFRAMPTLEPGKTVTFALKTNCVRGGNHRVRVRVASESITDALIDEVTTSASAR